MNNESKLWCGIDISKQSFDAALVADQRVRDLMSIPVGQFDRAANGISDFLSWLQGHCANHHTQLSQIHFVLEATGKYSKEFFIEICRQHAGLRISIVNPAHAAHFQKSLGIRNKTDALDARSLGLFARERKPDPYSPLSPQCQALQELYRQRNYYIKQRGAQESRSEQVLTQAAKEIEREAMEATQRTIKRIEAEIKNLLNREYEISRDIELLMSIPGVGLITATAVLAELGDLRRFARAAELASFVGLAPQIQESGTSVRGKPRISKAGNSVIRRSLYMATLTWTTKPNEGLGIVYARFVKAGKAKRSALMAIARKLLVLMRAILISGRGYEANFDKTRARSQPVEKPMKNRGKLRLEPKF